MSFEQISSDVILFLILYGITGTIPFMAAIYLLLRRGNAFAPSVTPPLRLRRWAASFFAVSALGHVWWYLFYVYSGDVNSPSYVLVAVVDCLALLTTIAGTLLAMLQDRKRPVWPVLAALAPFLVIGGWQLFYPNEHFMAITTIYILFIYAIFSAYMAFAVRRYGRWLNDNYADLENKKVWLSQTVSLSCLLLLILYALVDVDTILIYILHIIELVLFVLLLWRVETLPLLAEPSPITEPQSPITHHLSPITEPPSPITEHPSPITEHPSPQNILTTIDLAQIEQLLTEHCVATKLYLQHDLSSLQLAQAIGTNRFYLSQYFSRQGITYNTYINNLRINYFISRYQEAVSAQQTFRVQQLANESGYHSYSTFSLAFKQRMGQSVTAWMRQTAE